MEKIETPTREGMQALVEASTTLSDAAKYYWGYMFGLAQEFIIPFLESRKIPVRDASIIEIGCAEGGNLCAMSEVGARELVGTDIAEPRLENARIIADLLGQKITYSSHDVIYQPPFRDWLEHFDLALLRDVIEHLDDAEVALRNIRQVLKPNGVLYVTFPPYYSPFGGHQQTLVNWASKVPFMHLLPERVFERMIASGRPADKVEVRRLRRIRMTTTKFRRAAKNAGYSIIDEKLYFIRPVYKMKFGLNPVSANIVRSLPVLRDVVALEAGYLLRKKEA
ncbi:MAG TPA: class I SAM-dependent methyltransferase [Candidatus Kapabacteria bacterium]|nr:class I SAM-dependent methyltransferase [Candidatus Kapabacteria bacterium]